LFHKFYDSVFDCRVHIRLFSPVEIGNADAQTEEKAAFTQLVG